MLTHPIYISSIWLQQLLIYYFIIIFHKFIVSKYSSMFSIHQCLAEFNFIGDISSIFLYSGWSIAFSSRGINFLTSCVWITFHPGKPVLYVGFMPKWWFLRGISYILMIQLSNPSQSLLCPTTLFDSYRNSRMAATCLYPLVVKTLFGWLGVLDLLVIYCLFLSLLCVVCIGWLFWPIAPVVSGCSVVCATYWSFSYFFSQKPSFFFVT